MVISAARTTTLMTYDDSYEDDNDDDNDNDVVDSLSLRRNLVKDEASAKTTYQRSEKGPISIAECSADGQFITIENTGRKVVSFFSYLFHLPLSVTS